MKNVTRILKMLPQYRHQCIIVPKLFYLCYLNNISAISVSELEETGLTIENHRPWASNSSTLFSVIAAEKDIDIKVYKLFIYNNNKNHKRITWRLVLVLEEAGEYHIPL